MFTTVAYRESIDNAALQAITPVPDAHQRINGDAILVPRGLNKLGACYVLGTNITRARLVAPSLGDFSNYEIEPVDLVDEPASPSALIDFFDKPYELVPTEFVTVEASEGGAGATNECAVLWFTDGQIVQPAGEIVTVRATSATALVAGVWSNVPLTFASTLPGGRFACVGARVECAGGIAFRFVPVGTGGQSRPGALAYDTLSDLDNPRFRRGGLGTWFEFDNDTPPTVDILSLSADATQTIWLDLVYLGAGA